MVTGRVCVKELREANAFNNPEHTAEIFPPTVICCTEN